MEKKRLVAIGLEGPAPQCIPKHVLWLPVKDSPGLGALFFGCEKRNESDADQALQLALTLASPKRKMVVKEVAINIEDFIPHVNWPQLFAPDLRKIRFGETLVAPQLANVYERLFLLENAGEKNEPQFLLRGLKQRPSRIRGLTPSHAPLIGRRAEVSRLEELLEQIQMDQGQIVSLVGDAGIGKSRLVAALKELAKKRSIPVFEGLFPSSGSFPFQGFRQLVVGLAGEQIETLSRWDMSDAECDYLRIFLEPEEKVDRFVGLSDKQLRQNLFFSVRKLLRSVSRSPLVLILEDAHWADRDSLDLLEYVLQDIESTHALFVLTYRPQIQPPWNTKLNHTEFLLQPFAEKEVEHFAKALLNIDHLSSKILSRFSQLTLGNPFYVEEILRHLIASHELEIEVDETGKRILRSKDITAFVPTNVHALIASRFDRLPSQQREAIRWASLLGSMAETEELEQFLRFQGLNEMDTLSRLFEDKWLVEKSVFPSRTYQFGHDLLFDVVLESLAEDDRQKKHTVVGKFLSERYGSDMNAHIERIATHFLKGEDQKLAFQFAFQAGSVMESLFRFPQAAFFFEQATNIWEHLHLEDPDLASVYNACARSLLAVGELEKAGHILEKWKTRDATPSHRSRCMLARLMTHYWQARDNNVELLKASKNALQILGNDVAFESERFKILHDRVFCLLKLGRLTEALHTGYNALHHLNDGRYPDIRLRLWARLTFCATNSCEFQVALDFLEKARRLIDPETSPQIRFELLLRSSTVLEAMSQYEQAFNICGEAIKTATDAGLQQNLVHALYSRGTISTFTGAYHQGIVDLETAVIQSEQMEDVSEWLRSILTLSDLLFDLGCTDEAFHLLSKIESIDSSTLKPWDLGFVMFLRAIANHFQGDLVSAADLRRKTVEHHKNTNQKLLIDRSILRAICADCIAHTKPMKELSAEFHAIAQQRYMQNPVTQWHVQLTAYTLALHGGNPIPAPDMNLDPAECANVNLRQSLYVSKIQWLNHIGEKEKAHNLRVIYRKEREKIAEKVPLKYRECFFAHPMYRVPD